MINDRSRAASMQEVARANFRGKGHAQRLALLEPGATIVGTIGYVLIVRLPDLSEGCVPGVIYRTTPAVAEDPDDWIDVENARRGQRGRHVPLVYGKMEL